MVFAFPLGFTELLIILIIVLLIFGAGKLPQLGDALGRSIKNFKKATSENQEIDVTPRRDGLPGADGHAATGVERKTQDKV